MQYATPQPPLIPKPRPDWQRRLTSGRGWLAAVVVIALVVGVTAGFLVARKPASPSPVTHPQPEAEDPEELYSYEATVTIGPKAYNPSYTTIRAHTKVFFENPGTVIDPSKLSANADLGPVRAVAVNPTSPGPDKGFSQSGPIKPMSNYDYIFNKPGTYTFHDVSRPQMDGTIVVIADK